MNVATRAAPQLNIPFGDDRPDRPMEAAGIDILLAAWGRREDPDAS